jgi:hypothetical protein
LIDGVSLEFLLFFLVFQKTDVHRMPFKLT